MVNRFKFKKRQDIKYGEINMEEAQKTYTEECECDCKNCRYSGDCEVEADTKEVTSNKIYVGKYSKNFVPSNIKDGIKVIWGYELLKEGEQCAIAIYSCCKGCILLVWTDKNILKKVNCDCKNETTLSIQCPMCKKMNKFEIVLI